MSVELNTLLLCLGKFSILLMISVETGIIRALCPLTGWLMVIVEFSLFTSIHSICLISPGSASVSLQH